MLHELLTGLHPFAVPGALARDVEEAILSGEVPRMASRVREAAAAARGASAAQLARTLRGGLETIVRTAMHTEPHRRYAHAAALADDVRRHLAGRPLLARGDGAGEWTLAFARRHRLALAGALGVVAGVAVLALTQRARGDALPRLEAGATRRIAFDAALELDPQLSPDGTQLAYASDADGTMRIHVRPVAGGAARVVSAGVPGQHRAPRWSPDGGALAFQGNGALWRVALRDDATPVPLVRPARGAAWVASPAWSPDGRQLAYVQDWVVHVRDLATGATRALLPPRALAAPHSLAWSPDGTRLALVDNNAEFVFGLEGGTVNLGNIAPSALVVLALGDDHRTVRSVSRVTTGGALATSPAWLPDSRGLLYVSDTDGDRDVYHLTLAADGSARAPATRLTAGLGAHTIAVSRDGAQLTYSVFRSSANLWALALPARGAATLADARPLTTGRQSIEGFAISPDGTRLAYDSNVRGNQDVLVIPFDATRAVAASDVSPLVADAHDDFMPHWSPDGRELAYYRYDSSATRSLRVVSAGGGASRPVIAEPRNQRYPGWSRDGTALVFEREQSGVRTLWTVRRDVTGGWQPARPLVRDGGDPRWSPTSDTIAYVRDSGIWLVAATGGEPRRLVAFSPRRDGTLGVVQWSRDGRAVLYKVVASSGAATILRASLAGGPPERVAVLDDLRRPSARPEFDSDGRQLVVTLAERESDIWTMALRRAR
ncbi:MAG: hypothetical protein MUF21_08080 [Gemmatimonadaceae bacterium]|nr:hypothetical protein [Gemmatimonadaceae bacterium]